MKLTRELFVIPNGKTFILYAPLKEIIADVNRDTILLLNKISNGNVAEDLLKKLPSDLIKNGIVIESEESVKEPINVKEYKPTKVILSPTLDCNLRCIYCYASGGKNAGNCMSRDIAKAAVDLAIKNSKEKNETAKLEFHGGGEPLLGRNMELLKRIILYFRGKTKQEGVESYVSSATNGRISKNNLYWIIDNFDHLNLSIDGPEDIQNKQRPTANGSASFNQVMDTIKYLEQKKFDYGIRATITKENVSRMPEIVKFFHSISSLKSFHLEPLFGCTRCSITGAEAPSPEDFLKYLIKASKIADKLGVSIYYSGSKLSGPRNFFCNSIRNSFSVLPDGNVTSCLEICRKSDPRASTFIIGKYNHKKNRFYFNKEKISLFTSRDVNNIPNCKNCFAKYNCAGDCSARICAQSGSLYDTSKNCRCTINRGYTLYQIKRQLKGGVENEQPRL